MIFTNFKLHNIYINISDNNFNPINNIINNPYYNKSNQNNYIINNYPE